MSKKTTKAPETASNQMLQTSKTFPNLDGLEVELAKSTIAQWCDYARESGDAVHFISNPGVGKTSFTRAYFAGKGLKVLSLHLPTTDPDRLSVAIPQDGAGGQKVLAPSVMRELLEADVIIADESRRAKESVRNSLMEMIQNRSLGGTPLKEDVTFVLCNNWSDEGGVNTTGYDLAQESRYITIPLKDADVPWMIALGAEFADTDLTELFKVYNNLERDFPGASKFLSPRTLEHIIWCMLNGLPGYFGLPLLAGPRAWIEDSKGKNVTEDVMRKFAAALGVPYITSTPDVASKAIRLAVASGKNLMLQGSPGIGKTEYVKQLVRDAGINHVYWSMQNINPDEHVVPFPGDNNQLELMLSKVVQPLDGKEYVLIADEYYRAKAPVLNMMLEVTQGGTFGGQKVPVKSVIAMTNPRVIAGQRQNVGRPDRAQADRFFISIELQDDDIPANEYLLQKYGEAASPFIEWWKEDLDDLGRLYTPKRVLEKMIKVYQAFDDYDRLDQVRPYLKEKYVDVPLHDLKQRLSNRPVARLTAVLQNADTYIERMLLKGAGGTNADQEAHITVSRAVNNAEASELRKAGDKLVELISVLDKSLQVSMVKGFQGEQLKARSALIIAAGRLARARAAQAAAAAPAAS